MREPFKRTLTDSDRLAFAQLDAPTDANIPPDLTAQLRNVGSRIRKSVTEGYITAPSSRVFAKAQSTTTIFASARDINRDVFGSSRSALACIDDTQPPHKRTRSVSDAGSETEREENNNLELVGEGAVTGRDGRVIKPLRKRREGIETRSLPAEAFRFSNRPSPAAMESEEDWSAPSGGRLERRGFEAAVLFE